MTALRAGGGDEGLDAGQRGAARAPRADGGGIAHPRQQHRQLVLGYGNGPTAVAVHHGDGRPPVALAGYQPVVHAGPPAPLGVLRPLRPVQPVQAGSQALPVGGHAQAPLAHDPLGHRRPAPLAPFPLDLLAGQHGGARGAPERTRRPGSAPPRRPRSSSARVPRAVPPTTGRETRPGCRTARPQPQGSDIWPSGPASGPLSRWGRRAARPPEWPPAWSGRAHGPTSAWGISARALTRMTLLTALR